MNFKTSILLIASMLVLTSASSDFQKNVKAASKTLGGINCLVDAVFTVENLAKDFSYDIDICTSDPSTEVSQIVDYTESITKKTDIIIELDNNECQNAAYNEKKDAKKDASSLCASSMRKQMDKLYSAMERTINYINDNEDNITDSCSKITTNTFKTNLPNFDELVKNCAKLYKK